MDSNLLTFPNAMCLRAEGIAKCYLLGRTEVHALKGVSLAISAGSFFVLRGASGSGKSTLLSCLGAIDRPSSGRIFLGDEELNGLSNDARSALRARAFGFVFQSFNLLAVLSALENVEYPLLLLGVGARERRERARGALERVGMGDRLSHRPADLSGGQRQRVAIARALVKSPQVLFADEPTANLDEANTLAVLDLLGDLRARDGMTVVVASHDDRVVARASDVVTLRDGEVVGTAPQRRAA